MTINQQNGEGDVFQHSNWLLRHTHKFEHRKAKCELFLTLNLNQFYYTVSITYITSTHIGIQVHAGLFVPVGVVNFMVNQ